MKRNTEEEQARTLMKLLLWLLLLHQCRLTRQQCLLRALLQALRQSIAVNCRPALCATCPSACNYKWMYMHALKHWGWQAYCDAVEVSFFGSVVYVVEGKCMAIMDGLTQKKKNLFASAILSTSATASHNLGHPLVSPQITATTSRSFGHPLLSSQITATASHSLSRYSYVQFRFHQLYLKA